jgi:hypothetical protein
MWRSRGLALVGCISIATAGSATPLIQSTAPEGTVVHGIPLTGYFCPSCPSVTDPAALLNELHPGTPPSSPPPASLIRVRSLFRRARLSDSCLHVFMQLAHTRIITLERHLARRTVFFLGPWPTGPTNTVKASHDDSPTHHHRFITQRTPP